TVQDTGGRCTQRGQFRTRVVGAHSGDSSEQGWSVHTAGTVQNTGGWCTQQAQFRTQVVSAHNRDSSGHRWSDSLQTLRGRWLQTGTTSGQHSRDIQRSADSSSSQGTQQQTASRDMQPRIVCRVPQQQRPGHSAADMVQGCSVDRLTDLQGLAGSQLWGLTFEEKAHAELWRLPTLGYCRGLQS
ncbi:unnamed protein product, partial [Staurois parvus]